MTLDINLSITFTFIISELPDGRTQVVRYTADWKNGYNAEVSYE